MALLRSRINPSYNNVATEQGRDSLPEAFDMNYSEDKLRVIIDTIPTQVWSIRPDGSAEFFNQHSLPVFPPSKRLIGAGRSRSIPTTSFEYLRYSTTHSILGRPFEVEGRFRRFDGEFRRFPSPLLGRRISWRAT